MTVAALMVWTLATGAAGGNPVLPDRVGPWTAAAERVFDRRTLYDYIDGGAEIYLAYGFRKLVARKYICPGRPPIVADVFDMGSAADAFGVFSIERFEPDAGVGQGSEYAAGLLRFWKGRWFVAVSSSRPEAARRKDILAIGRAVADAIAERGELPPLVNCLPPEDLRRERVVFFHTHGSLSYVFFVSDENLLDLGRDTDAVLAQYLLEGQTPRQPTRLLVVHYPRQERAARARDKFRAGFLPDADAEGLARTENSLWCALRLVGRHLAVVFDAPSRHAAVGLLDRWQRRLAEVTHGD